jgi:hypothetical protein
MKAILVGLAVFSMASAALAAVPDQFIRCSVDTAGGDHLAGETSSLARGVDLTQNQGVDFYAYINGRTDRREFRVEAYDSATGSLVQAKTTSYYTSEDAQLTLEQNGVIFACEMKR